MSRRLFSCFCGEQDDVIPGYIVEKARYMWIRVDSTSQIVRRSDTYWNDMLRDILQGLTSNQIFEMEVALIGATMNATTGATQIASETPQISAPPPQPPYTTVDTSQIFISLREDDPDARTAVQTAMQVIANDLNDGKKVAFIINYGSRIYVSSEQDNRDVISGCTTSIDTVQILES